MMKERKSCLQRWKQALYHSYLFGFVASLGLLTIIFHFWFTLPQYRPLNAILENIGIQRDNIFPKQSGFQFHVSRITQESHITDQNSTLNTNSTSTIYDIFSRKENFQNNSSLKKDKQPLPANDSSGRFFSCNNCSNFDFPLLIGKKLYCKVNTSLVILIVSKPTSSQQRRRVRATWASKCNVGKLRCFFVIGNRNDSKVNKALLRESDEFNDILQFNFRDSYRNLTYKTMRSLTWAKHFCSTSRYVMKTDDDSYINMDLLLLLIKSLPSNNFYGGKCTVKYTLPVREIGMDPDMDKWFIKRKDYPFSRYPKYCYGSGYILSADLLSKVVSVSKNVPFVFIEDVYTGLCVQKFNINPVTIKGFSEEIIGNKTSCELKTDVFTVQNVPYADLLNAWDKAKKCKNDTYPSSVNMHNLMTTIQLK